MATKKAEPEAEVVVPLKIVKPAGLLDKFKSKRASNIAGVETLLTSLSIIKIGDAGDFVRLHPDEDNYWSDELCFVSVPIKGEKREQLHLIDEEVAMAHLSNKKIKRHRLALATKPYDAFFLCMVPSTHLDNSWNSTALKACREAQSYWVQVSSRKDETPSVEGYKTDRAKDPDAFPAPKWLTRTLDELITCTFGDGTMIETEDHPALRRLVGLPQNLK